MRKMLIPTALYLNLPVADQITVCRARSAS